MVVEGGEAFTALDIQLTSLSFPLLILLLLLLFLNFFYSVALSRSNMFFFQLVIMSGTVLLAYYMECTDLFSVHVQGFFCNDAELMKPYPGTDESSFAPPLILYCLVAVPPKDIKSKKKKKKKERQKKRKLFYLVFHGRV